jgi:phage host-nuclease inhibitor protein Gam
MRDLFNLWKTKASLAEIVRFMNEEGPVRQEVIDMNREVKNLKTMLNDKMILNPDEVQDILDCNEKAYKSGVNKVLKRLQVYQDPNYEWLKPYCFDKLKQFVKER